MPCIPQRRTNEWRRKDTQRRGEKKRKRSAACRWKKRQPNMRSGSWLMFLTSLVSVDPVGKHEVFISLSSLTEQLYSPTLSSLLLLLFAPPLPPSLSHFLSPPFLSFPAHLLLSSSLFCPSRTDPMLFLTRNLSLSWSSPESAVVREASSPRPMPNQRPLLPPKVNNRKYLRVCVTQPCLHQHSLRQQHPGTVRTRLSGLDTRLNGQCIQLDRTHTRAAHR